jgi:hypothetical protein
MRTAFKRFGGWLNGDLRRKAGFIAFCVCIVMIGSDLFAATCVETWENELMTAYNSYTSCYVDAVQSGIWGQIYGTQLCALEYASNSAEAHAHYATCMSVGSVLPLFQGWSLPALTFLL